MHPNALIIMGVFWCSFLANANIVSLKEQLSSNRNDVGGIQIGDKFYFAGGFEYGDNVPTNIVEIYNFTSRQWNQPIHLDEPRAWISTAVIGQNIFFIGGAHFEGSCTMLYNSNLHQYEDIGCGPTVRTPMQVSSHNSTVTVLGGFSADFYDATNGWYNRPKLTSWMQSISGGIKLVHENLIIGIGGINTTTLEQLLDAWIYDTSADNLIVVNNVTTTPLDQSNSTFSFSIANGKIVIFTADRYFAHEFGTTQWFEHFMAGIYQAVPLTDVAFTFNASGYMIYYYGTNLVTWTPNANINWVMAFENQVAIIQRQTYITIYENGVWTDAAISAIPDKLIRWSDVYLLYNASYYICLYNSSTKSIITTIQSISDVKTIIPVDNTTIVFFAGSGVVGIYNITVDQIFVRAVPMIGEYAIGRDIISLKDQKIFINLAIVAQLVVDNPNILSQDRTVVSLTNFIKPYRYIDVYNHITGERQSAILMNMTESVDSDFMSVAVIDDMLVVMNNVTVFRYNTTSGESFQTTSNSALTSFSTVCTVNVVNGVGHLPASNPSAIISVDSISISLTDKDDIQNVKTTQFVTTEDNVLYITAKASRYEQIYTYDVSTQILQTFSLPVAQDRLTIAITNDILVALGSDGYVYATKLNDYSTWYQVPLEHEFVPTIAEGMNDGTIMVVGGKHVSLGVFTNEITFVNASAIVELGTVISINQPVSTPMSAVIETPSSTQELTVGELVAAIVVPIVVVVAGVIALVIVLIKRRKRKSSTTIGLEARYGAWFTPFNQITFKEQLGQGASGQVFKGTWKNTTVALKVSMTQANTSVIAELELMMQLRPHPNVVQLLGFSVHPETDSIILIIEFCEGGSLDAKLYDNRDEISLQTQVQWLAGIAKGLSHLHSNNIVHRDVAARNVLLHRNEPKLTDFGMSRLVDEQKQHGTTKSELGPIRWMSPESLKNKEYSTKSDIWSFGILMYEVIARQEPHNEADPIEIGRLVRDSGSTPVIPSSCHPQLADVMKQCWQMSPQSRPKIESIIECLESIQTQI